MFSRADQTSIAVRLLILSVLAVGQLNAQPLVKRSELPQGMPLSLQSLQVAERPKTKSVMLAIAASVLLPGLGEYYAGNFDGPGKYALTAEGAIWVTYASFRLHGDWVRNDARAFAVAQSGADLSGKDEQFEVNLGNFQTTEQYNTVRLQQREPHLLYEDPSYRWSWTSDADRQRFKEQRIRSDRIYQASRFVIAAAIVNRVISAFSAGKAVGAHNRAVRSSFSFDLHYVPEQGLPRSEGMVLTFGAAF